MKTKTTINATSFILILLALLLLMPITVHANNYLYEGTLDLSSTSWQSYNPGLNYTMQGGAAGTIYHGDVLKVIEVQINSKGNHIARCYSPSLEKEVYVSEKYIKKVSDCTTTEKELQISQNDAINLSTIPDGVYRISPKCAPNSSLDLTDWNTDTTPIQIWTSENQSNQLWYVRSDGNGYYTITSVYSGKLLDVKDAGYYSGTPVQAFEMNGTDAQAWEIVLTESGYEIISKLNGLSLDVQGASSQDGTRLQVYESNNTLAQRFDFYNVFVYNPDIYLKQQESNTCTLCSATMVYRKYMELTGNDYSSVTESSMRKVAWSRGLLNTFSYNNVKMTCKSISSLSTAEKENYLKQMLQQHAEGIVVYNRTPSSGNPHAVVLVAYDNELGFMVADPASRIAEGMIPLADASKNTNEISEFTTIWYIQH